MFRRKHSSRGHLLFAAFLLFPFAGMLAAQEQSPQWRPISPAELQMAKPLVEPDADAEALIWEVRIDDSDRKTLSKRNYVRVKVFNERGRDRFAKFDIPYIKGISEISELAAHVVRPDGTTTEISGNDVFERDLVTARKLKVRSKSFAVPKIEPGVIVEYQFTETVKFGTLNGSELDLQKDIPVQVLTYIIKPYQNRKVIARYYNTPAAHPGFENDRDGFYRLTLRNVPAFKEERFMPPDAVVKPYVVLSVDNSFFGLSAGVPDSKAFWSSVAISNSFKLTALKKHRKDVDELTEKVIAGASTPEEKLRRIYDFCQQKITNTSYTPLRSDDETWRDVFEKNWKDIAKNGSGSASATKINLFFGAMADAAGFDIRWVEASRRNQIFMSPEMTDRSLMTFAGIGVVLNGEKRLFAPGIKYAPFGELPWYREGAIATFVGSDTFGWGKIPMSAPEKNLTKRSAKLTLSEDGTLEGTVSIELYGLEALTYRQNYYDEDAAKRYDAIKSEVTARISNAEVTNISIENFDDTSKPVVQRYSIKVPGYGQRTGKRIFLQPDLFEYGSQPFFASTTRVHNIFFQNPWSERDEIEILLPATFVADGVQVPEPVADKQGATTNKIAIEVKTAPHVVLFSRDLVAGKDGKYLYKVSEYESVKSLWDAIQKANTVTITLKLKE